MQEPWTKNELDVNRTAELCAYKMFYSNLKVPALIKSQIVRYHHFNFGSRQFDNLAWLIMHQFVTIAFDEFNICFESSKKIDDFNVKGAWMYRYNFSCEDQLFSYCDVVTHKHGESVMDSFVRNLVGMHSIAGCHKCAYTGHNCSYCASGKLIEIKNKCFFYDDFKKTAFPVLSKIIGKEKSIALYDLSYFLYCWLTDVDFRLLVSKNESDWPRQTKIKYFRGKKKGFHDDMNDGLDGEKFK